MKRYSTIGLKVSAVLFSAVALVSCSNEQDPGIEYAPDMYYSVALDPYKQIDQNKFNPYGMNMRLPAKGTVARGKEGYNLYLSENIAEAAGEELKNPLALDEKNLVEGKLLYSRFCTPCHGDEGDGQGLVGIKFKGVPSFTAGRVATLPEGHIYHVISEGRGRMQPYGSQVNPTERWQIVMYVQQLQKGETGTSIATGEEAEASSDSVANESVSAETPN